MSRRTASVSKQFLQIDDGLEGSTDSSLQRSAVTARQVVAAIGLLGVSSYIGNALGDAIFGAVWTNTLPIELIARVSSELKEKMQD